MKKHSVVILGICLLAFILTACSDKENVNKESESNKKENATEIMDDSSANRDEENEGDIKTDVLSDSFDDLDSGSTSGNTNIGNSQGKLDNSNPSDSAASGTENEEDSDVDESEFDVVDDTETKYGEIHR